MKIAIVGCGNMGSAIARILSKKHKLILCDRNEERTKELAKKIGATYQSNCKQVVKQADVLFLAIKPKDVGSFARDVGKPEGILISVLAGKTLVVLEDLFQTAKIVRMMPNLPLICGQGVIGLSPLEADKQLIEILLADLGELFWISEKKLEMLTVLAGSGPAFVYHFIEALVEAGVDMGLTTDEAEKMVFKTVEGAISLLKETSDTTAELKKQISSPGGVTIAGLVEMEKLGVKGGIIRSLLAAYDRIHQMGGSK